MSKFNLSRKNLIIGVASLSILALIITFFIVNFSNPQKLSSSTNNSNSSNSVILQASTNLLTNSQAQNSSITVNPVNLSLQNSSQEAKNNQNSANSQINSSNQISQTLNLQKSSESTASLVTNLANFSNSISITSNSSKKETQTYQNEFLPNFKLNYPKDWKMETITKPTNIYQNILRREIILTKNDSKMIINLGPIIPIGCSGIEEVPILADLGKYKRYKTQENPYNDKNESNDYFYSNYGFCDLNNKVKSNIQAKDAKEKGQSENNQWFKDFVKNYETIDFILSANLESNSPTEIKEADEIIKNSILE